MKLHTFNYESQKGWPKELIGKGDSENTLVLAFSAPEYFDNREPLKELIKAYPKSIITGCSTSGEIFGTQIYDHSIAVGVMELERTKVRIESSKIETADQSFSVGETLSKRLMNEKLKNIFVLSEGLNVNGTELVKGLNLGVSSKVIITGGLSGDGDRFKRTWVIDKGIPCEHTVVVIGFYGDHIQVGHGSRGGWDTFGPERRVTRSKGNVVYEINGKSALALYKEYLGERAQGLPSTGLLFPLMIRENEQDKRELVRTILAINEKEQSLTFAGDVPTGFLGRLMKANFDRLVTGANEAAISASNLATLKPPILAVDISCVGRRLVMGERTEEETEATFESFPAGTEQIGFYSYGELSPFTTGKCDLHNQTMTITTFAED